MESKQAIKIYENQKKVIKTATYDTLCDMVLYYYHLTHNLKAAGSNPAPATTFFEPIKQGSSVTGWACFCLIERH